MKPVPTLRRSLAVTVLLTLLVACSSDNKYLPALLADPMASYKGENLELIDHWEQAEGHSLITDKPLHAEVERTYRIHDQSQTERLLEAMVEFAESEGWRIQQESSYEYRGSKDLAAGSGRIHLSAPAEDVLHDPDGQRILRIKLDFGPVRFDETTTSIVEGG